MSEKSTAELLDEAKAAISEVCRAHDAAGHLLTAADDALLELQKRFSSFISALQGKETE